MSRGSPSVPIAVWTAVNDERWAERTAKPTPLDDRIQLTRAEFLAAIDRAFNAGVDAERARAARDAEQSR